MRLYLIRHGAAEEQSPAGDGERALTPKGKFKLAEEAKGMRRLRVRPEIILTSPLRRARETAAIIAEGLGGIGSEELPELGQGAYGAADIAAALNPYEKLHEVALVGHQPSLGELASLMLTGSTSELLVDLKKGAVVCLEKYEGANRFSLIWSLPPKVLRSL